MTQHDAPKYPGRGDFIEGKNPFAPDARLQETSFLSREVLERIRDTVDKPLARYVEGKEKNDSFSAALYDSVDHNDSLYLDDAGALLMHKLMAETLPNFFRGVMDSGVISADLLYRMFQVAADDGISTACANVLGAYPFTEETVSSFSGKLTLENDRFVNPDLTHPGTGEDVFSKCPGFLTAQAIEKEIIKFIKYAESYYTINPEIDSSMDIGKLVKAAVDQRWKEIQEDSEDE